MHTWLRMRQLMGALDVVMREWARLLRMSERDLFLLMLLASRGPSCGTELASRMGRKRQQVQRNLLALERRSIIEPSLVSDDGKVQSWRLTEFGQRVAGVLRDLVKLWETHLTAICDIELVLHALNVGMSALVNCPNDPRGWGYGLMTPTPIIKVNLRTLESLEALTALQAELAKKPVNRAAERRSVERETAAAERRAAAEHAADEAFRALWRN